MSSPYYGGFQNYPQQQGYGQQMSNPYQNYGSQMYGGMQSGMMMGGQQGYGAQMYGGSNGFNPYMGAYSQYGMGAGQQPYTMGWNPYQGQGSYNPYQAGYNPYMQSNPYMPVQATPLYGEQGTPGAAPEPTGQVQSSPALASTDSWAASGGYNTGVYNAYEQMNPEWSRPNATAPGTKYSISDPNDPRFWNTLNTNPLKDQIVNKQAGVKTGIDSNRSTTYTSRAPTTTGNKSTYQNPVNNTVKLGPSVGPSVLQNQTVKLNPKKMK